MPDELLGFGSRNSLSNTLRSVLDLARSQSKDGGCDPAIAHSAKPHRTRAAPLGRFPFPFRSSVWSVSTLCFSMWDTKVPGVQVMFRWSNWLVFEFVDINPKLPRPAGVHRTIARVSLWCCCWLYFEWTRFRLSSPEVRRHMWCCMQLTNGFLWLRHRWNVPIVIFNHYISVLWNLWNGA